jgi:hypothetical protein
MAPILARRDVRLLVPRNFGAASQFRERLLKIGEIAMIFRVQIILDHEHAIFSCAARFQVPEYGERSRTCLVVP